MLAIDGRLGHQKADSTELTRYAVERARTGIAAATASSQTAATGAALMPLKKARP